jgi:hypothetical protein
MAKLDKSHTGDKRKTSPGIIVYRIRFVSGFCGYMADFSRYLFSLAVAVALTVTDVIPLILTPITPT